MPEQTKEVAQGGPDETSPMPNAETLQPSDAADVQDMPVIPSPKPAGKRPREGPDAGCESGGSKTGRALPFLSQGPASYVRQLAESYKTVTFLSSLLHRIIVMAPNVMESAEYSSMLLKIYSPNIPPPPSSAPLPP